MTKRITDITNRERKLPPGYTMRPPQDEYDLCISCGAERSVRAMALVRTVDGMKRKCRYKCAA